MLKAIFCITLSAILLKVQFMKLKNNKDRVVFTSGFLLASSLLVTYFLDYSIPSILKLLEFVYQPFANELYDYFQKHQTG